MPSKIKPETMTFRLSKEQKFLLKQRAKIRKITVGEYIRHVLAKAVRLDWGFEKPDADGHSTP